MKRVPPAGTIAGCDTVLTWGAFFLGHINRELRVRGTLSYRVGLAVVQLRMSLPEGRGRAIALLRISLVVAHLGMNFRMVVTQSGDKL